MCLCVFILVLVPVSLSVCISGSGCVRIKLIADVQEFLRNSKSSLDFSSCLEIFPSRTSRHHGEWGKRKFS